jgi:hypothetical protein
MLSRLVMSLGLIASLSPVASLAAERPVVVELFTSQGCSSCPPANAYLNELSKGRGDVLALAFHVTYWDRLGWKDPFSMQAATQRQDVYGHRFGDGSYTPEIVVDGAASMVGSDRGDVGSAIEKAERNGRTAAAVSVTRNGGQVSIQVGAGSGSGGNAAAPQRAIPRRTGRRGGAGGAGRSDRRRVAAGGRIKLIGHNGRRRYGVTVSVAFMFGWKRQ